MFVIDNVHFEIVKVTPAGLQLFVAGIDSLYGSPTVDAAGNFFAINENPQSRVVMEVTPAGVKSFIRTPGMSEYEPTPDPTVPGWQVITRHFTNIAVDPKTDNLYLTNGEALYRLGTDHLTYTLVAGGHKAAIPNVDFNFNGSQTIPVVQDASGNRILDIFRENQFDLCQIACGPDGKIYMTDPGLPFDPANAIAFVVGTQQASVRGVNPAMGLPGISTPLFHPTNIVNIHSIVDGPSNTATTLAPHCITISLDGKTIYFTELDPNTREEMIRMVSAL